MNFDKLFIFDLLLVISLSKALKFSLNNSNLNMYPILALLNFTSSTDNINLWYIWLYFISSLEFNKSVFLLPSNNLSSTRCEFN